MNRRLLAVVLAGACLVTPTLLAEAGQDVTPTRMTFKDAIARAIERNPSGQQAAAEILRAEALLGQVRAAALPQVTANVTATMYRGSDLVGVPVPMSLNQMAAAVTA